MKTTWSSSRWSISLVPDLTNEGRSEIPGSGWSAKIQFRLNELGISNMSPNRGRRAERRIKGFNVSQFKISSGVIIL